MGKKRWVGEGREIGRGKKRVAERLIGNRSGLAGGETFHLLSASRYFF